VGCVADLGASGPVALGYTENKYRWEMVRGKGNRCVTGTETDRDSARGSDMSSQDRTPRITDERLKLLQNMPVFGGLNAETLRTVLETAAIVRLPKGEYFFNEGDEGDSAYVLEQGRAMFWKQHLGTNYPMRILGKGECFGEMAMIGIYPRSGSTQAIEDCVAIKITYEIVYQMLRLDPEQCVMMLMNMARDLSRRLRDADNFLLLERVAKQTEELPKPKGAGDKWKPI
jgi:hypothetical protein